MLTAYGAGWQLQMRLVKAQPDWYLTMIMTPLNTFILVSIFLYARQEELAVYAVIAPALMALWNESLFVGGEIISRDRSSGTLEGILGAPGSFYGMLAGRIGAVSVFGLCGFFFAWVVGALMVGHVLPIAHPGLFAATMILTAMAMSGAATIMSSVFILARSARSFQNALSYPFYLLGGVLVPVVLLPAWVHVPSSLFFLSWSADLLRSAVATTEPAEPLLRLAALTGLGICTWLAAGLLMRRMIDYGRRNGSHSHV